MADIPRDDDAIDLSEDAALRPEPGVIELPEDGAADDAKLPPQAVQRADGSISLPLLWRPVTLKFKTAGRVSEETTSELVFHALNGKDMQVITGKPPEKLTVTAMARSARMVEIKMQAIYERMDGRDINAAERCVLHFMDGGRPTGR